MAIDLGGGVSIDLGTLIATRALVCANSGGGKSWLIRRIVEGAIATIPTIIIDREGEFSTLRECYDVVLVGQGGEVACAVATAAKLARRLIELRLSAVIDLSDLAMGDKRRFVRMFLESLISLPRSMWSPTLVVIDEAHQFAPESGRESESLAAVVALMDQGRKRGFGGILATQRLAKLHKDAAAEANNIFVGRFAQDVDLKRAGELLGFAGREGREEIRTSAPGQFYAIGPAIHQPGVSRFRAGPVRTTHPDPQHRHAVNPPQPSKRILAVVGELVDLKREVEAEASEIDTLRAKVREQAATIAIAACVVPSVTTERIDAMVAIARATGSAEGHAALAGNIRKAWATAGETILGLLAPIKPPKPMPVPTSVIRHPRSEEPRHAAKVVERPRVDAGGVGVSKGVMHDVMVALAQADGPLTEPQIAVRARVSVRGGTWTNVRSMMKQRGWIAACSGSAWEITGLGRDALGPYDPLPTGAALFDYWLGEFGDSMASKILRTLRDHDHDRRGMTTDEISEAGGLSTGGTYTNNRSKLRSMMLVEDVDRTRIRLVPELCAGAR